MNKIIWIILLLGIYLVSGTGCQVGKHPDGSQVVKSKTVTPSSVKKTKKIRKRKTKKKITASKPLDDTRATGLWDRSMWDGDEVIWK